MNRKIFSFLVFLFFSSGVHAGATSTLAEQLVQTGVLGAQFGKQAKMVIQQAEMIHNQLDQQKELLTANKKSDPGALAYELGQNKQDMDVLQKFIGALTNLAKDGDKLRSAQNARLIDINQSGLTFEEYVQREKDLVAAGNSQRRQLIAHEIALMENVNTDAKFVQDLQDKIPAAVGANESLHLLNTQINRMVAQNATMIHALAANNSTKKSEVENEKQRKANLHQAVGTAKSKEKEWLKGKIDELGSSPPPKKVGGDNAPLSPEVERTLNIGGDHGKP